MRRKSAATNFDRLRIVCLSLNCHLSPDFDQSQESPLDNEMKATTSTGEKERKRVLTSIIVIFQEFSVHFGLKKKRHFDGSQDGGLL